jgi:transcriptional regulator with XRE-family HTH domain
VFNKIIFGQRLRLLRKARNLSLKDVADSIGSLKSTIGNLERGTKAPSIDMLLTLADFFDVSLDYLVGRSDDPRRY